MPADADFAVLEMGMNHPGELTPLSRMARPHVCVITTIAPAHTEFFSGPADIAKAKAEIYAGAEPGAVAVLNRDIPEYAPLASDAEHAGIERIVGFGEHPDAAFRVLGYTLDATGSEVQAVTPDGELSYRVGIPGRHWVMNSLCVLAAVSAAGGDVSRAADSLSRLAAPSGRGQRFEISVPGGKVLLIDESYNASPEAMRAALAVLAAQPVTAGGRRIAVLGDMLELGDETVERHAELAKATNGADIVCCVGEAMGALWNALPESRRGFAAKTSRDAAQILSRDVGPGDVVMVKGSAGLKMGQIVTALKDADVREEG
ncbi:MAG: UDP-N-acetylmuramoylalanyl-D-glutamyl-2, 6-diaminopimelate--D-alanyl-D-alanine ligase, partial [Alphaproteobacteria bacterium]|nr:UDP-N-acetylmuramoylalanyl-D-glutamyl-2, 6-diaminopimelate--D-alanyl-D-alanine ligase [Alphaproteobacteria bacterium]